MKANFKYIFIVIAVLQIAGILFLPELRMITKPLIMISLGIYYFLHGQSFDILFFLAIVAAFFGDLFLMWEGQMFFIFGLGSFLLMQILYTIVFQRDRGELSQQDILGSIVVMIFGGLMLYVLLPNVEQSLFFPVIIYTVAISIMVISALLRKKVTRTFLPILLGAVLFMISDALLAYGKFVQTFDYNTLLVMLTYMAAQYLIVVNMSEKEN